MTRLCKGPILTQSSQSKKIYPVARGLELLTTAYKDVIFMHQFRQSATNQYPVGVIWLFGNLVGVMITELLEVKLTDLPFHLAVQKCLAIEQANKDVQVLQGEQGPVNLTLSKLGKNKPHPSHHLRLRVPGVRTLRSLNLVTTVRDHITHKSVPSRRNVVFILA